MTSTPLDLDPNFTGSRSKYQQAEAIRVSVPFKITINEVDNFTNGKIQSTQFEWAVLDHHNNEVARRDYWNHKVCRSRKAAISQAKAAMKNKFNP